MLPRLSRLSRLSRLLVAAPLLAALAYTAGCRPDVDIRPIGQSYDLYDPALYLGTWRIEQVIQTDIEAVNNAFPDTVQKRDLTGEFAYEGVTLTIEAQNGEPSRYAVQAPEDLPYFLPRGEGRVTFDDGAGTQTRRMILTPSAAPESGQTITLSQLFRPDQNRLQLRFTRRAADGTPLVHYDYRFRR